MDYANDAAGNGVRVLTRMNVFIPITQALVDHCGIYTYYTSTGRSLCYFYLLHNHWSITVLFIGQDTISVKFLTSVRLYIIYMNTFRLVGLHFNILGHICRPILILWGVYQTRSFWSTSLSWEHLGFFFYDNLFHKLFWSGSIVGTYSGPPNAKLYTFCPPNCKCIEHNWFSNFWNLSVVSITFFCRFNTHFAACLQAWVRLRVTTELRTSTIF